MGQKDIGGLVSLVLALGWKPNLREVLGVDDDVFYSELVARNPERAYEVALHSNDPAFLKRIIKGVIKYTVGGTDLESSIREMYLNPNSLAVPGSVTVQQSPLLSSDNPCIEELATTYRLHVASYLGNRCYVDIEKELEDSEREHTQEKWVALSEKVPSAPLYFTVMDTLRQNKDHPDQNQRALVEEVREMFAKDFKLCYMMTSTRVRYAREGMDIVVHDCGYATERREEANIVGADGYINKTSDFGAAMNALLGTSDCQKIEQAESWITGKRSYLYRINKRPKEDTECALVLGVSNVVGFGIFAGVGIYGSRRARGMVAHVAENSP